jgi:hypothetical protein
MKCQIPNCNNNHNRVVSVNGIYKGVSIQHVCVYVCKNHTREEIQNYIKETGNREALNAQVYNPFTEQCIHEHHQ